MVIDLSDKIGSNKKRELRGRKRYKKGKVLPGRCVVNVKVLPEEVGRPDLN